MLKSKVLTVIEEAPLTIQKTARLKITDEATMTIGVETLSNLNTLAKKIKAERELITKPMNEALQEVRGRYKPTEDALADAIAYVRDQMTKYQTNLARIEAEKKAKIDAKVAAGKMSMNTGLAKREAIVAPTEKIITQAGKVNFKAYDTLVIDDEKKIPREYMVPDQSKILSHLKTGKIIPGARIVVEQRPINRTM